MALEVDFITLGDASSRLGVPAPTLRHWTDQMEEFDVHFVLRNGRNERVYESSDIEIFKFLRDLKEEYGRRTTTRDLGYMIMDKGKSGELKLRRRDEVPVQNPTNRTTDLLNQEDIKKVLESDRAKQVIGYLVNEATQNLRESLVDEIRSTLKEEFEQERNSTQMVLEEIDRRRVEREKAREEKEEERLKFIEEREKMREERDRQARIEWEKKQEEEMKQMREIIEAQKEKEKEPEPEPEKPKSWLQKILGQ